MVTKKKKTARRTKWEITTNRFVGYLDIMGFKDMVARNTHEKIYMMMKKVSEAMSDTIGFYGYDDGSEMFNNHITMTMYSDSIMIYSKDDSKASLNNFIGAISSLTDDLFKSAIPHKGAVAFGTMTLDFEKSIFFGQPLIDAYLMQDELSFYGVVVHATAEIKRGFKNDESVIKYSCPFKSGYANHLTIFPITLIPNSIAEIDDYVGLIRNVSRLRFKTSGSIRKYIDNTEKYLDFVYSEIKKMIGNYNGNTEVKPKRISKGYNLPF